MAPQCAQQLTCALLEGVWIHRSGADAAGAGVGGRRKEDILKIFLNFLYFYFIIIYFCHFIHSFIPIFL